MWERNGWQHAGNGGLRITQLCGEWGCEVMLAVCLVLYPAVWPTCSPPFPHDLTYPFPHHSPHFFTPT